MRLKKWCFWIVVLEKKTLENPLDCKEVNLINPKGNHPWIFIERANAVAPKLWPPDVKSWLIEKNPLSNEKRLTGIDSWERPRAGGGGCDKGWDGWMVSPTQWTWVWVGLGVGDGQGGLTCCGSWDHKESDMTEGLNWTELQNLLSRKEGSYLSEAWNF